MDICCNQVFMFSSHCESFCQMGSNASSCAVLLQKPSFFAGQTLTKPDHSFFLISCPNAPLRRMLSAECIILLLTHFFLLPFSFKVPKQPHLDEQQFYFRMLKSNDHKLNLFQPPSPALWDTPKLQNTRSSKVP